MKLTLALILASGIVLRAKFQHREKSLRPDEAIFDLADEKLSSEVLKEALLENLGLSSLPDISKLNTTQEEVSKAYSEYRSSSGEELDSPRLWSLEPSDEAKRKSGSEDSLTVTFNLEEKAEEEEMELSLWSARLARIKLEVESDDRKRGYLTLRDGTNSFEEHLETKVIEVDVQGFDVTAPVSRYLEMASRRIVFNIRCRGCRVSGSTLEILLFPEERSKLKWWKDDEPERMDFPADQSRCHQTKMTVPIKKIPGMNFIIHPLEFEAYRCEGNCPHEYRPANNHAIIQSYVHHQDRKAGKYPLIPMPCCAPKTLKNLDIIYLDDYNTIRSGILRAVIVEDCACS